MLLHFSLTNKENLSKSDSFDPFLLKRNRKRPLFLKQLLCFRFATFSFPYYELVFCYQNCSDLLREKIVLFSDQNCFEITRKFIQTVKGQNKF
jgi:hypothetical protein